jgi:hypothetical protein
MARVGGFEVAYTHRGSWKAKRSLNGHEIDEIPVAWRSDWVEILAVWFKDQTEVQARIAERHPFIVALAPKRADGSSSSEDIIGLFEVLPLEATSQGKGIRCSVVRRITASDYE